MTHCSPHHVYRDEVGTLASTSVIDIQAKEAAPGKLYNHYSGVPGRQPRPLATVSVISFLVQTLDIRRGIREEKKRALSHSREEAQ